MAAVSGKSGTLKLGAATVAPIAQWKLELTSRHKAYAANDTGGAVKRLAGVDDASGSFQCQVSDSGNCPVRRGQQATAQFHLDASGANYYEVPIIIDRIGVTCDITGGAILAFAVDFSGNGPVSAHGIAAFAFA